MHKSCCSCILHRPGHTQCRECKYEHTYVHKYVPWPLEPEAALACPSAVAIPFSEPPVPPAQPSAELFGTDIGGPRPRPPLPHHLSAHTDTHAYVHMQEEQYVWVNRHEHIQIGSGVSWETTDLASVLLLAVRFIVPRSLFWAWCNAAVILHKQTVIMSHTLVCVIIDTITTS